MVRQREIIQLLLKKIKNIEITIVNALQIEILKENFGDKVKYIKRYNNIELIKTKSGFFDIKNTIKTLDHWNKNLNKDFLFFKKNFQNHHLIISDFVPQIFYFSKKFNINCYGVCHFTWSWYFDLLYSDKKKMIISKMNKYENMAKRIFFPPFTPEKVQNKIFDKEKIENINFITKLYQTSNIDHKKKTFLIMDSGTKTLSKLISDTIPYISKMKKYIFYIGISSLTKEAVEMILNSNNILPVTTLKGMYSYIGKVDHVIVRGGFNSITECLLYKKPAIFMNEKYNPEIDQNLKIIFDNNLGSIMSHNDWKFNFKKKIEKFIKNEVSIIKKNLKKFNLNNNGAEQILKKITLDTFNDKNNS